MRHINRSAIPPVLERNGARWLKDFQDSNAKRPDSSKYAHKEIREYLKNMSHNKCFYCENSLKGTPSEVDHHIEVSVDRDKAFEWINLYLACHKCNHKENEFAISSAETLDPCTDTDDIIKQHLTYDGEVILPVGASEKGQQTIKKYHLDRDELDYLRLKQLKKVGEAIMEIDKALIQSHRSMNQDEKNRLLSFTISSQPFSYMCETYLRARRPEIFE